MYLVEIEAGREQVYPSVATLAAAIRGGVIGPDSRIFHRASSSWISITVHPEYRKAIAARPPEPLPPLARNQWTFFGAEPPARQAIETADAGGDLAAEAEPAPKRRNLRSLFRLGRRGSSSASDTRPSDS